jgi:hypothetical protein
LKTGRKKVRSCELSASFYDLRVQSLSEPASASRHTTSSDTLINNMGSGDVVLPPGA